MQSVIAFVLLEIVNHIEHCGLQRQLVGDMGSRETRKPEPFGMVHAWSADHVASNSLLVNLQRHTDYHMQPWKPYPTLALLPGSQLFTGYAGCIHPCFTRVAGGISCRRVAGAAPGRQNHHGAGLGRCLG